MVSRIEIIGEPRIPSGSGSSSDDVNDSFNTLVGEAMKVACESNFQILDNAGTFDNSDNSMTEKATSASGANSTINTGLSDAVFDTDHYFAGGSDILNLQMTANDTGFGSSRSDNLGGRFQVSQNIEMTRIDRGTGGTDNKVYICSSWTNSGVPANIVGGPYFFSGRYATIPGGLSLTPGTYYFVCNLNDGTSRSPRYTGSLSVPQTNSHISVDQAHYGGSTNTSYPSVTVIGVVTQILNYTDSEVIMDSNTLEGLDTDKGFVAYWKGDIPSGTSASYIISDGVTEIESFVNPITKMCDLKKIDSLTSISDYIIKAKFYPTTTVTPKWYGGATKIQR